MSLGPDYPTIFQKTVPLLAQLPGYAESREEALMRLHALLIYRRNRMMSPLFLDTIGPRITGRNTILTELAMRIAYDSPRGEGAKLAVDLEASPKRGVSLYPFQEDILKRLRQIIEIEMPRNGAAHLSNNRPVPPTSTLLLRPGHGMTAFDSAYTDTPTWATTPFITRTPSPWSPPERSEFSKRRRNKFEGLKKETQVVNSNNFTKSKPKRKKGKSK